MLYPLSYGRKYLNHPGLTAFLPDAPFSLYTRSYTLYNT